MFAFRQNLPLELGLCKNVRELLCVTNAELARKFIHIWGTFYSEKLASNAVIRGQHFQLQIIEAGEINFQIFS